MIMVIIMIISIITIGKATLVPREEERHGRRGGCQDEQSSQPTSGDRIYQPDQNNLRVKEEPNKICSGALKLFKEARKVNPDKYRLHDGSTGRKLSTRAPADFEVTRPGQIRAAQLACRRYDSGGGRKGARAASQAARRMEKRGNTQLCGGIIGASATTIESSKLGLRPKDYYALCLVLPAWQVCCVVCCTEVEGWGVETVTGGRAGREMTLLCG